MTVKVTLGRLEVEPTVTVTGPVPGVAVFGTFATTCVLLQLALAVATPPLKLTALLPCVAPKLEPVMVTAVPTAPKLGDTPVTNGVVPTLRVTLSNVAVVRVELLSLLTTKPTYTFCAMVIVWLVPTCTQFTPSVDVYPLKRFPLRTSFNHFGAPGHVPSYVPEVLPPVLVR